MNNMMAKQDLMQEGLKKVEHANSEMKETILKMETKNKDSLDTSHRNKSSLKK